MSEEQKESPPAGGADGQEEGQSGKAFDEQQHKPDGAGEQGDFSGNGTPVGTARAAVAIEISLFTKDGGDLTKKVHWNADRTGIVSDSRDCKMSIGVMSRAVLSDWRDLAHGLPLFPGNTALALGRLKPDLPAAIRLVTKKSPECDQPGCASRTADNILYARGQPAVLLLDFDTKGMTPENKARLAEFGGFLGALAAICPGFEKVRAPASTTRRPASVSARAVGTCMSLLMMERRPRSFSQRFISALG